MSASLVGSEMCIRDRYYICRLISEERLYRFIAVSYTHLTLPTILRV
ncbi:hypothetical protein JMUB7550_27660 [Staphylococcus aureus]